MKQDYLKKLYEPNYHYCTRTYGSNTSVEHRLGSFDAQKEWKKEKEACAKFLNTKAYKSFIKDDYVILIGRTGTGKTSILKRLQYDIESGTNKDYKYVIPINFKPYLGSAEKALRQQKTTIYQISSIIHPQDMV